MSRRISLDTVRDAAAAIYAAAAALSGRAGSGTIAAVVSGGNIDLSTFTNLVCRA